MAFITISCILRQLIFLYVNLEMELLSSSESSVMDEMRPDTEETDERLAGTVVTENKKG